MYRTMIAVAGVLAALPAVADETAGPAFTTGTFTSPGQTITTKVKLAGGQWYALAVDTTPEGSSLNSSVVAPSRKTLASFNANVEEDTGRGFRAPRDGTYSLTFTDVPVAFPPTTYPWSFRWRVLGDCPPSPATPCTLKLGKVQTRWLAYAADVLEAWAGGEAPLGAYACGNAARG